MSTHFQMYPVDHLKFIVYVLYSNIQKTKNKTTQKIKQTEC